ncbi:MAG: HAMP domain-containing sensor histidine kinase [Planctomycetaceae bacterium]
MRWPIRHQILLPFLLIQLAALAVVATVTAWLGGRQAEQEIISRIAGVQQTLERASFPMTPTTLQQLRDLSGAHFLVVDDDRRVRLQTIDNMQATLDQVSASRWQSMRRKIDLRGNAISGQGERFIASWVQTRRPERPETVVLLVSEEYWRLAWWRAVAPPLILGGALLLLTAVASTVIAGRFGRRIRKVGEQVNRIAAGDFTPIPEGHTNDELRDLAIGVNRMAGTLRELMQQVRDTERSNLLNQIVGGISHQLRNAITGTRLALQLHRRGCPTPDDEALHVALRQLTLTEEQIRALLRVSRQESQQPQPGDVLAILRDITTLLTPACQHQDVALRLDSSVEHWEVSDAAAWRAALLNVLTNAVEAAGPKGHVNVDVTCQSDALAILIRDDGPGIPPQVQETLFDPFVTTKPEGCGLGLALARQAALQSGGTLTSRRELDCTLFEFRIPRPPVASTSCNAYDAASASPGVPSPDSTLSSTATANNPGDRSASPPDLP